MMIDVPLMFGILSEAARSAASRVRMSSSCVTTHETGGRTVIARPGKPDIVRKNGCVEEDDDQ